MAINGITLLDAGTDSPYRRIAFDRRGDLRELSTLKTIDDVFVDVAAWAGIDRPRTTHPDTGHPLSSLLLLLSSVA